MSERYNGWSNWETWNTNLWMTNDEGLYREARGIVDGFMEDPDDDDEPGTDENETRLDEYHAGKALRDWWEEMYGGNLDGPLADLFNAAMSEVDWEEIARGLAE